MMRGTRASSTIRDLTLSCFGSLFAFLLVRWVSEPSFGFTTHLLIYLGGALVFSFLGYWISGLNKVIRESSSDWSGRRLILMLLAKEIGQAGILISPFTGEYNAATILLAVLADFVFSLALIFYPRVLYARMRKESQELHDLPNLMNALVMGCDDKAIEMAREAEASGHYSIMGLLSKKPELNGKVIDHFIVFYADSPEALNQLQWRLGGIDCVLIPKGQDNDEGDAQLPPSSLSGSKEEKTVVKDHMGAVGKIVKRSFDLVLSAVLLLLFLPLFILSALAVYFEDGRPVIYKQERIGRGGKAFNILKFRTMRTDAEQFGPALYVGDEDPRLTRVGKFLRQHHLDELPQLWNVFRGDMSFIGYRPERQFFIDKIMAVNPRYRYLYQIRPGVTSYATLYNGYTDTLEKKLRRLDLDLYYLRNHSVGFDIRILGLTFLNIAGGKKF